MKKILLFGNYCTGNIGDQALLVYTLALLKKQEIHNSDISILTNKQGVKMKNLTTVSYSFDPVSLVRLLTAINKADVLLVGGGGMLDFSHDESMSIYCLTPIAIAKLLGKKVSMIGVGCSLPDKSRSFFKLLKPFISFLLNRIDVLIVRDLKSKTNLEELKIKKVKACVDLSFNFTPMQRREKERLVVINLRRWFFSKNGNRISVSDREKNYFRQFLQTMSDLADYVTDRYGVRVVFAPFSFFGEYDDDVIVCEQTRLLMKNKERATVLSTPLNSVDYLDLLSRASLSIGMRYHFLAFSAIAGTPILGIAYNQKVDALSKTLGSSVISVFDLESVDLKALVDNIVFNKDTFQNNLRERVASLHNQSCLYETISI